MKAWWPLLLLALPLVSAAQTDRPDDGADNGGIYRILDADGNVVFTDNPPDEKRAEEVQVGPTNTMDGPATPPPAAIEQEQAAPEPDPASDAGYQSITITAPQPQANLRLPQDNPIEVQVSLSPSLKAGHRVVILDNGAPLEGASMNFPNPGQHTLVAQVRDDNGVVLIESQPLVFYVMRTTVNTGARHQGGDSALPTRGGRAQRGEPATPGSGAARGGATSRGGGASLGGGAQRVTRPSGD